MKATSLESGSKGNALLVSVRNGQTETTVMFDCGFGIREIKRRLERVHCLPEQVSALVVTHEHGDHARGVLPFLHRYRVPVWMSEGTFRAIGKDFSGVDLHLCRDGDSFTVRDLQVSAFAVSHDAREPLQFHVTDGAVKFGMLTDTGQVTVPIRQALSGCNVLMLECNYDDDMLKRSSYPFVVRKRIGSVFGHLSNRCAADFLSEFDSVHLTKVIGAHLSETNNLPDLAFRTLHDAVDTGRVAVMVASQVDGFGWTEISG